jgi:hypothetical protein
MGVGDAWRRRDLSGTSRAESPPIAGGFGQLRGACWPEIAVKRSLQENIEYYVFVSFLQSRSLCLSHPTMLNYLSFFIIHLKRLESSLLQLLLVSTTHSSNNARTVRS